MDKQTAKDMERHCNTDGAIVMRRTVWVPYINDKMLGEAFMLDSGVQIGSQIPRYMVFTYKILEEAEDNGAYCAAMLMSSEFNRLRRLP